MLSLERSMIIAIVGAILLECNAASLPMQATGESNPKVKMYRENIVQAKTLENLDVQLDHFVGVSEDNGTILFMLSASDTEALAAFQNAYELDKDWRTIPAPLEYSFVMPGFIDAHVHAPQFDNMGVGYDMELLPWLKNYTLPLEEKFDMSGDGENGVPNEITADFVLNSYRSVVEKILDQGTTTASYYATVDPHATLTLAKQVQDLGQRAYVGKVNSDINMPAGLKETTAQSIASTKWFIEAVQDLDSPLITPVISPRFALGASFELMTQLGDIARQYNLPVQTHLDENKHEVADVLAAYPFATSYTDVYAQAGLLNVSHIILGHCVHLTDAEIAQLGTYNTSVGCAHCPLSNYALNSGIAPVRKYLGADLRMGLGSDVAGGYSSDMLQVMRGAILASKSLYFAHDWDEEEWAPLEYYGVLNLATKGSAAIMGLGDQVGTLEPGYQWDALHIDLRAKNSMTSLEYIPDASEVGLSLTMDELVSKFIYEGDSNNIVTVWVNGQVVKDKTEST
ncbi:hypothetical protein SARC_09733 [Sphaeroforma arctica JP610]|uniref:Amidohydrolase-related domain-containing protein n=1 Tax=Sphaeroforma arctica JP610 TaxID=667725 RepID=A0A0L0FMT1_9EUKA|nr:hypothetical protein SARC_09733 [Sphaeroforma arctica JP610]KNC77821.1 hypothetical protein SARC_09733 [Sphaeroforma arctica JP610]|eukprot:XP_014151723.1 hypothetical protein SARC_09733 [Sphaeroforma arctica JP610]